MGKDRQRLLHAPSDGRHTDGQRGCSIAGWTISSGHLYLDIEELLAVLNGRVFTFMEECEELRWPWADPQYIRVSKRLFHARVFLAVMFFAVLLANLLLLSLR
jgi:hypothetical protein